jgi:hypothetical protein
MRTVLTEAEGRELLSPYFPTFIDIFNKSLESTEQFIANDNANGKGIHFPHVKAMVMWHYAVNYSVSLFSDHEEFKPKVLNKVYGVSFNDALFIRFKKLNDQFQTSNIPTKQSIALNNQTEISGFPSKPCILTVGYVMDSTCTSFQSINIICRKKGEILWNFDILNNIGSTNEIGFEPFDENVSKSVEKLLTIKEEKKKKKAI